MSYVFGLGADEPAVAGRGSLCETACRGYFGNAVRRRRCTDACLSASVAGACSRACEPVFDTENRRASCTSACHYTFQATAAGVLPPIPAPSPWLPPPASIEPNAPSSTPISNIPWKWVGVGAAVLVGIAILKRRAN